MRIYRKLIVEATRCSPDDAPVVEEFMREVYRVLDGLDRKTFFYEARRAYDVFLALDPRTQEEYRREPRFD